MSAPKSAVKSTNNFTNVSVGLSVQGSQFDHGRGGTVRLLPPPASGDNQCISAAEICTLPSTPAGPSVNLLDVHCDQSKTPAERDKLGSEINLYFKDGEITNLVDDSSEYTHRVGKVWVTSIVANYCSILNMIERKNFESALTNKAARFMVSHQIDKCCIFTGATRRRRLIEDRLSAAERGLTADADRFLSEDQPTERSDGASNVPKALPPCFNTSICDPFAKITNYNLSNPMMSKGYLEAYNEYLDMNERYPQLRGLLLVCLENFFFRVKYLSDRSSLK